MKLALILLRKDLLKQRSLIILSLGMLVITTARNMTGMSLPQWTDMGFRSDSFSSLSLLLTWFLVSLLTVSTILDDSLCKRDRFLQTRPFPTQSWIIGKALFLLLVIVAPSMICEGIRAARVANGITGPLAALLEHGLILIATVFTLASFASLCGSLRQVAISIALAYGVMTAVSVLTPKFIPSLTASDPTRFWSFLQHSVVAIACCWIIQRWQPSTTRMTLGPIVVGVATGLVILLTPWRGKVMQPPLDQAAVDAWDTDNAIVGLSRVEVSKPVGNHVGLNAELVMSPLAYPPEWNVLWRTNTTRPSSNVVSSLEGTGSHTTALATCFRRAFGDDVQLIEDRFAGINSQRVPLNLGGFDSSAPEMRSPNTHVARLEAQVFRWDIVATLPIRMGAQIEDPLGRWTIVSVPRPGTNEWRVGLIRETLVLQTDQAVEMLNRRFRFFLYLPDRPQILPLEGHANQVPSWNSSVRRQWIQPNFQRERFEIEVAEFNENIQLVICAPTLLGSKPIKWQTPTIVAADHRKPRWHEQSTRSEERLSPAEVMAALSEIPKLNMVSASQNSVTNQLFSLLSLVSRSNDRILSGHPILRRMTAMVPQHLEIFVSAIAASDYRARETIQIALTEGLPEDQREALINHYKREPKLLEVILHRGWLQDARDQVIQQLKTGPINRELIAAATGLNAPETHQLLLGHAVANPDYYSFVRNAPELRSKLDTQLKALWQRIRHVVSDQSIHQATLRAVVKNGQHDALADLFQLAQIIPDESLIHFSGVRDSLIHSIELPGIDPNNRYDASSHLTAMRQHRPEQFQWDALHQKFRLEQH